VPPAAEFEDEVPVVLKLLGYPFNIQKTALQSVGAPQTWPKILAALSWLVDLLRYAEAVSEAESDGLDGFDVDAGERMFLDYLQKGYALFLSGQDDMSSLEEQIAFTFESKNASLHKDIEALTAANAELSREHAVHTARPSPLEAEKKTNDDLRSDQHKFEKHIADLHEHRTKVSARLQAVRAEAAERQAELAALVSENGAHRETIAAQELTP
jgi:kinetochore protein NDC80